MTEITNTRTLEVVAAEIRTFTASMLNNIIEIGRRLCEAKELVPHGEFGDWVKENTGYSKSTANNFMRLFQEYGAAQGSLFGAELSNVQTFGNLSYSKALALLQLPAGEREEFVRENDVESMSTRELNEAIRERDAAREDATKLSQMVAADAKTIDELARQVKELESRPIDVAVQEPDPAEIQKRVDAAVDKAVKEAKAAAAEDKKKLKDQLAAVQKEMEGWKETASDAVNKLKDADPAEKERLEREIETLRKQIAMSDAAVASFNALFKEWGSIYGKMIQHLKEIENTETRAKLLTALRFQIGKFREQVGE